MGLDLEIRGMNSLSVLGVIPARGGSKGIPRKNIRLLGGRPLLDYTVRAALRARHLKRLILSTDDPEIARAGEELGLEVPFLRPGDLARDDTPTLPVLQHAVRWLEQEGERCDAVCLLQPTHPFRPTAWIDGCIARFRQSKADSVVTVLPVPHTYNPHWVYFEGAGREMRLSTGAKNPIPRRQALPAAWHREGSVYVCARHCLMEQGTLYGDRVVGYRVGNRLSVNLDTPGDWEEAEARLDREPGA